VYCDLDLENDNTRYTGLALGDSCNPYVNIVSRQGCDVLANSILWDYLEKIEPYLGVVGIVMGTFLCFFGLKMIKPSIFMAGLITVTLMACLFFYAVYANSVDDVETFWYFLAVGALLGLVLGFLLAKYVKIGAAVLAGWGGFAAGLMLNESILFKFEVEWLFWVSMVVCVVGAAVLAFVIFDHAMIISTSILGAFFLVRGISVYAGHYYNMFTIIKMLKKNLIEKIDPLYWAYIGGFIVVALLGCLVQFKMRAKGKQIEHPYPTRSRR
jgi:hypothetical protein